MENATDALKMAGAVLMFVLALSVTILSFGQAREVSDTILDYRDRETTYKYVESDGSNVRTVNLETIIPSIFRAYLENYKIVFEGIGFDTTSDEPIYSIKQNTMNSSGSRQVIPKYSIDLETDQKQIGTNYNLGNNATLGAEQKAEFIRAILYGPSNINTFKNTFTNIDLPNTYLYDRLQNLLVTRNKVIREYLGVYYQDDNPNVPDVMKVEKRIITYRVEDP